MIDREKLHEGNEASECAEAPMRPDLLTARGMTARGTCPACQVAPVTAREDARKPCQPPAARGLPEAARGPSMASAGHPAAPCAACGTEVAEEEGDRDRSPARAGCTSTCPGPGAATAESRPAPAGEPERPVMERRFVCIEGGRRYYAVVRNGLQIFVGTQPECERFLAIHERKVAEETAQMHRVPRGTPGPWRVYRTLRA